MKKKIMIYTTPICPQCELVKQFLQSEKISFEAIDISFDEKVRDEVFAQTKQKIVPVIKCGDEYIVGFNKKKILQLIQ